MHPLGKGETLRRARAAPTSTTTSPNWPWPPGLLLVPPAHGHCVADRLAIGDGGFLRLDGHAEAIGEALGRHAQMHLALSVELHFGHLGVLDEGKRAILLA